jgi:hypothetical protein
VDTDEENEGEKGGEEQSDDAEDEEDEEEGDKHQTSVNVLPRDNEADATLLPPASHEEELRQADQAQKEENIASDIPTPFASSSVETDTEGVSL